MSKLTLRASLLAVVTGVCLCSFANPATTADEIFASRDSLAGRAFTNPMSVWYAYDDALSDAKEQWGKDSLQAADAMMLLGHATPESWDQRSLYTRALGVVRKNIGEDHKLYGRYLLEAASGLLNNGFVKSGRKYVKDAEEWHTAHAPNGSLELAQIAFFRARLEEGRYQNEAAVEYFTQAAAIATDQSPRSDELLSLIARAHGEALRILEMEERRDDATTHVIALAHLAAEDGNARPRQLFMVPPPYPKRLIKDRQTGTVTFEITVDEQGFVHTPAIVNVDGPAELGETVLKVLERWRFSPRLKNGEAVSARLRNKYFFTTEEDSAP